MKFFEVCISVSEYRFSTVLSYEQLYDSIFKLCNRVFKLTLQEQSFFDLPNVLGTASDMECDESTCFQVSKSRNFTLNIKRIS